MPSPALAAVLFVASFQTLAPAPEQALPQAASEAATPFELAAIPGPALAVRGQLWPGPGGIVGKLDQALRVEGRGDLAEGRGEWTIVLRDVDSLELARFPFVPVWNANGEASFEVIVPDLARVTCVHLETPEGELDWKPIR